MTKHMANSAWTDALLKEVAERYARGESASAIARALNFKHRTSFSRNAIISKLHRTGLSGTSPRKRSKVINKSRAQMAASARKSPTSTSWWAMQRSMPKLPPSQVHTEASGKSYDAERLASGAKTFVDLEIGTECRWPLGEPKTAAFRMCAAEVAAPGASYCKHHLIRSLADPVVLSPTANDSTPAKRKAREPEAVS